MKGLARKYFGEARYQHRGEKGNKANTSFDKKRASAVANGLIRLVTGMDKGTYEITVKGMAALQAWQEKNPGMSAIDIVIEAVEKYQA